MGARLAALESLGAASGQHDAKFGLPQHVPALGLALRVDPAAAGRTGGVRPRRARTTARLDIMFRHDAGPPWASYLGTMISNSNIAPIWKV
jgi:hypothetical protein